MSNLALSVGFLVLLGVLLRSSVAARVSLRQFLGAGIEAMWTGVLEPILLFLWFGVVLNALLAVFNLLPVPPLDGNAVFQGMVSPATITASSDDGMQHIAYRSNWGPETSPSVL